MSEQVFVTNVHVTNLSLFEQACRTVGAAFENNTLTQQGVSGSAYLTQDPVRNNNAYVVSYDVDYKDLRKVIDRVLQQYVVLEAQETYRNLPDACISNIVTCSNGDVRIEVTINDNMAMAAGGAY